MKNEVAYKYSRAFFSLGKEKGKLTKFQENLKSFWETVEGNEDLKEVLFHKRILPEDKKSIIEKIFKDEIEKEVLDFVFILIDKRREYSFKSIYKEFNKLVDKEEKILHVEVSTAVEMNQKSREKLKTKLDKILDYTVIINNRVNPDIIGGMVMKIEDYIIDGSIRYHLNNLQQNLKNIPVSKLGVN
ncbi:MAG: ATP synthase F1 subunit delta [Bacillota bacterium]